MHTVRIIIGGGLALALAGLSVICCYIFGTHLAPGNEGQVYGVLGGTADALKALLPLGITAALASGQKSRAIVGIILFATFSLYSFVSELGLYALSRDAQSSSASAGKEAYEDLKAERKRVQDRLASLGQLRPSRTVKAELAGQFQNSSWQSSGQCQDATTATSRTFCAGVAKLQAELASAEEAEGLRNKEDALTAKINGFNLSEVLKSADPQSEALARLTGLQPSNVKDALALLVALLIELGSGLGLYAATASGQPAGRMQGRPANPPAPKFERVTPQNRPAAAEGPPPAGCPVKAFARAAVAHKDGKEVAAADLYAAFARWAEIEGREPLSPAALGRKLSAMQFQRVKRGGKLYYQGIEVRPGMRPN